MPFYYTLKADNPDDQRTARGLLKLREQLRAELPKRDVDGSLLLATWNIREFDSAKYGPRLKEPFHYIAEIVSCFDLVAIQEVREDTAILDRLAGLLGRTWRYVVTDVTGGTAGNRERLCYFYDSRKVTHTGLAGEVVLPPVETWQVEGEGKKLVVTPSDQVDRSPYLCGFQAGWFKFNLCTVHITYGADRPDCPERAAEIDALCSFLSGRADSDAGRQENLVLLGDFNIFNADSLPMQSLLKHGFKVPRKFSELRGSNVKGDRVFDQIAFKTNEKMLGYDEGAAGVLDFYRSVFCESDADRYLEAARANYEAAKGTKLAPGKWPGRTFREWRTYQMSDHLPLWVQLKTDFCDAYLARRSGSE